MTVPTLTLTPMGGAEGAPVLVLGPSLGTSTILWETAAPHLRENYRLLAWDLPGHGESAPASDGFTVAELADAVAHAVREAGVEKALYAGVSLGGATGLELLLRHPDLVEGAAIVASGAKLGEPEGWNERAQKVRAESTSALIVGSAQRWFAPGSMEREPELSGRLLHVLQNADDNSYAFCCEALAAYDVRARLGEVTAPVVAVWGEFDQVAPEEKADEIATGVRDGRTARISDAAHLPPAEQPETTARALRDFFEGKTR